MRRATEDGITSLRREVKLVLEPAEADALAQRVAELAAPLETLVAAVYFDSAAAALVRRVAARPRDCTKVRVKRYHPHRGGTPDWVVLEVKRERGRLTSKERRWLPPVEVPGAVARTLAAPLSPVVATTYRRWTYQPSPAWRVTVDRELAFHAAGWELFEPDAPPWHVALRAPFAEEPRVIVELKYGRAKLPGWLAALAATRAVPYSKFLEAMTRAEPDRRCAGGGLGDWEPRRDASEPTRGGSQAIAPDVGKRL